MLKNSTFAANISNVMVKPISILGKYILLMGRVFSRPERIRVYFKQYVNELHQLGINSIGIVLLILMIIICYGIIGRYYIKKEGE